MRMQRIGIVDAIFKKIEQSKARKNVPPFKNFIKGFTTFFALIVAVLDNGKRRSYKKEVSRR